MRSFMYIASLFGWPLLAAAAGPTGALNDTGQTQCVNADGTALGACTMQNSGSRSANPGQDGVYGRDAADRFSLESGFSKPAGSGGSGGFAFTPLDVDGNPIPLTGNPPVPSTTPRCVKDNVTNLIWEVKTNDGGLQDMHWTYGWGNNATGTCYYSAQLPSGCNTDNYITALNLASVCPVSGAGPWRLPTLSELGSIVDYGTSYPSIDADYFPDTESYAYWSANSYAPNPAIATGVVFDDGRFFFNDKSNYFHVRLVRRGQ